MRHHGGVLIPVWIPQTPLTPATSDLGPGTAIVTDDSREPAERVLAWFEGNLYGASNLERFADRAWHAAGRMQADYPTVAVRALQTSDLLLVGYLNDEVGELTLDPDTTDALCKWLSVEPSALVEQLLTTSARHTARRQMRLLDPMTREHLRRHGPSVYRDTL
jgi:hypothetical protein